MRRIVSILLYMCLLIVCALVAWFGYQQLNSTADDSNRQNSQPLKQVTADQMLSRIPRVQGEFELVQFYPGKRFVALDFNDDGRWERVYVPVFDRPLKDIRQNYRAIVVCFAGVSDDVELRKQLQSPQLTVQFWPYSQKFDNKTYNELAERYSSLDFNRSIIVHSGFPKSAGIARYLLWVGAVGALFAMMGMGWQSLGLIAIAIRKSAAIEQVQDEGEEEEDEDSEFLNRAGLPTIKRE